VGLIVVLSMVMSQHWRIPHQTPVADIPQRHDQLTVTKRSMPSPRHLLYPQVTICMVENGYHLHSQLRKMIRLKEMVWCGGYQQMV
jgi:hypothetical protein